jgi:Nucleotidyl transferase AbiEii toxin, Type IV TA system
VDPNGGQALMATGDADGIWRRLGVARGEAPGDPNRRDHADSPQGYPNTLRAVRPGGVDQGLVFEPALLHFANAYRAGDPRFADASAAQAWLAARRTALDVVLEAVAASEWAGQLMVRGSILMRSWYPETAREPGDLDFVVIPETWELSDPRTEELFAEIARAAERLAAQTSDIRFAAAQAKGDDIWTYDRVPGRRLMLPWQAEGTPGGWVQLDFVFGEVLPEPPERAAVTAGSGRRPGASLPAASKRLSLAWKLVWLITDMHPQGKDLYDAVLLAEDTELEYQLLRDALVHADGQYWGRRPFRLENLAGLDDIRVGWGHFQAEYPSVDGAGEDWLLRLCEALEPTFVRAGGEGSGTTGSRYESDAEQLALSIEEAAEETDDRGAGLQQALADLRNPLIPAVVITRELVGRERMSLAEAVRAVLSAPSRWRRAVRWDTAYNHLWAFERTMRAYGLELRQPWPAHLADSPIAALVREAFEENRPEVALEILAPLADDPDPRLCAEPVLRAVVDLSEGRLELLYLAVQRARADPDGIIDAAAGAS